MKSVFLALAGTFGFAAVAIAAVPPAPTITVAASGIKQLEFDITPVTQATSYELWFRAAAGAPWVKYAQTQSDHPRFRIGVSVHLLDWTQARYYVKACNASGCSASNEVAVNGEQLSAIGYFKPYVAGDGSYQFGGKVAASADGKTIAVLSNEDNGGVTRAGLVQVYRKTTSGWRHEASFLPDTPMENGAVSYGSDPLAISGDGNLIAFGHFSESIPGTPGQSGAVYLFRRVDGVWGLAQTLGGNSAIFADNFGYVVKLDDAGRTLAVLHHAPPGATTLGTVEMFRISDDSSSQFVHDNTLPVPLQQNGDPAGCAALALSGNGTTLMRSCTWCAANDKIQVFKAPGWIQTNTISAGSGNGISLTYDASRAVVAVGSSGHVYKLGENGYSLEAKLTGTGPYGLKVGRIAISRDGKLVALGNEFDHTVGLGPIFPPYDTSGDETGAVVIQEHKSNGAWVLRRTIKSGSTNDGLFGTSVALGDNGKLLVVGAPRDGSSAIGIDGNRDDESVLWRGAVWVY